MTLNVCKHLNQLCGIIFVNFYNFLNNDVIMSSLVSTGNCKLGHDCRRMCTHRRRDETRQFRLVGVGGVYWALLSGCVCVCVCVCVCHCVLTFTFDLSTAETDRHRVRLAWWLDHVTCTFHTAQSFKFVWPFIVRLCDLDRWPFDLARSVTRLISYSYSYSYRIVLFNNNVLRGVMQCRLVWKDGFSA